MGRATLRKLGWDTRRFTILMPLPAWDHLQDWADSKNTTLADAAAVFIQMWIDHRRAFARVELTELGEQAADEPHVNAEDHKLGTGGAEW